MTTDGAGVGATLDFPPTVTALSTVLTEYYGHDNRQIGRNH
jgi:hypothetical protein